MNTYTTTLLIAIPIDLLPVASKMGQAFDPDVGGSKSFDTLRATHDSGIYAVSYSPATETFTQQAMWFKNNPSDLFTAVAADYATRWPDLTPPTLAECLEFCMAAHVVPGMALDASLESVGMTRIIE